MLIAESLLLVSRQPDGKPATRLSLVGVVPIAITAALLMDLIGDGRLDVVGGRIQVRPGAPPQHPVLQELLHSLTTATAADLDVDTLRGLTTTIGPDRVPRHLAAQNIVDVGRRRMLGPPRYPIIRTDLREQVMHACRQAVLVEGPVTPQVAVVLRLCVACAVWQPYADAPDGTSRAKAATQRMQVPPTVASAVEAVLEVIDTAAHTSEQAFDSGGDDYGWDD